MRNNYQYVDPADRIKYIHNKIGSAQAQGLMSELGSMFRHNSPVIEGATQDETKIQSTT